MIAKTYNVVVISPAGMIIGVEAYDPAARPESVSDAAARLAARLDLMAPEFRNSATDAAGNEWGKMTGDLTPGMVEVTPGRWAHPQEG